MLQQTQVQVVVPYSKNSCDFQAFRWSRKRAAGSVLSHWAGLGYYSRARNLHKAAQAIVENYEGEIPRDLGALREAPRDRPFDRGRDIIPWFWIERSDSGWECQTCTRSFVCNRGGSVKIGCSKNFGRLQTSLTPNWVKPPDSHTSNDGSRIDCLPQNASQIASMPIQNDCLAFQQNSVTKFPTPKQTNKRQDELWIVLQIVNQANETLFIKRPQKVFGADCTHRQSA